MSLGRCWHCFPGSVSAASAVSRTAGLSASRCGPCHSKPSGFYQQEAVPRPHFPRGSPVSGPGASLMAAGPHYPAVRWGMASDTGAASLPVSTDECIGIQHLPTADWVPGHPLSQKLKLRATFSRSHGPGGTAQDLNPGPPSPRGYPRSHPSIHHRTDTPLSATSTGIGGHCASPAPGTGPGSYQALGTYLLNKHPWVMGY